MADPEFPDPDAAMRLVPGCARCPRLVDHRERIAWGKGPAGTDVVVVGEAPAAGDPGADRWRGGNWTGLAYTSRHSGRRVRELFASLGIEAYYTNAVKCFPSAAATADDQRGERSASTDTEDPPTNREPTAAERHRCGSHLRAELRAVDPAVVVATGRHATEAVLAFEDRELDGFLDAVLEPVDCRNLGVTLLPILHPSYQEVWLSRLGYEPEAYREAIAERLP